MAWPSLLAVLMGALLLAGEPPAAVEPAPAVTLFAEGSGLPSVATHDLAQDAQGRVWVGTQRGLGWIGGGRFHAVPGPSAAPDLLVGRLLPGADGLWVGTTGSGLLQLREGGWRRLEEPPGVTLRRVLDIVQGPAGAVRILALGGKVFQVDGSRLVPVTDLPCEGITALLVTPEGWVMGTGAGLWAQAPEGWRRLGDFPAGVQCLARDPQSGRILVGTSDGAWVGAGSRWQRIRGLASDPVVSAVSGPGFFGGAAFWICSRKGLSCVEGDRATEVPLLPGGDLPQLQQVRLSHSQGRVQVWVNSLNGVLRFQLGGWDRLRPGHGPGAAITYAMAASRDGSLWFGDIHGNVHHLSQGQWRTWKAEAVGGAGQLTGFAELPGPPGRWLVFQSRTGFVHFDGQRWQRLGWGELPETQGSWAGLAPGTCEGRSGVWVAHDVGLGFWSPGSPIRKLMDIPRGLRWVLADPGRPDRVVMGGFDGLVRIWEDGRMRTLVDLKDGRFGVCAAWVRGQEGRILRLGTYAAGVQTVDLEGRVLGIWNRSSVVGWPSNVTMSLMEDHLGRTWVGTDRGMAVMDGAGLLATYTREDGLPADLCTNMALMEDGEGTIWASTARGSARLRRPEPGRPGLPVVAFGAMESEAGPFRAGALLRHPARRIRVTFELPILHREGDVRYQTLLEGLDGRPTPWSSEESATFATLPSGRYRLAVWAMDGHGRVSGPVYLPFRVAAPWWRHPLMYLLYVTAVVGGGYGLHRVHVLRLRVRNAELAHAVTQATCELRVANDRLYHLNDEKNRIIGVAAHDLRNPLSAILLSVDLLQEEAREDQAPDLERIQELGRGMNHILHELLDVNAIEADATETPRLGPVACGPLWADLLRAHRRRAEKKDMTLLLDGGAADLLVRADANQLHRVLENLLSNAIKYSPRGRRIWLRSRPVQGWVRFEVKDEGPGLTAQDQDRVFGAYARLSARPTAGEASVGLGLSIVKRLVVGMGGRIGVESVAGEGATFWLELPGWEDDWIVPGDA